MFIDLSLPVEKPAVENFDKRETDLFQLGHHGTHLDRLLGERIPLEYCRSRGLLFDVSGFSAARPILAGDVRLDQVRAGYFVILRTGAMRRNPYASKEYLAEHIEISWELINGLLEKKVRFIGLDARGLRQNQEHREADLLCEKHGAYVIENLINTELLPANRLLELFTAWFDTGGTGLPCRVVAEIASS